MCSEWVSEKFADGQREREYGWICNPWIHRVGVMAKATLGRIVTLYVGQLIRVREGAKCKWKIDARLEEEQNFF